MAVGSLIPNRWVSRSGSPPLAWASLRKRFLKPAAGGGGFLMVRLGAGGFARGEPFGEPELETLTAFDGESLSLDLVQGAAQEVLALERHGEGFEYALDGAGWPGCGGYVIGQQQQPAGAQHPGHLADRAGVAGDGAQRERADDGVEGLAGDGQCLRIPVAQVHVT